MEGMGDGVRHAARRGARSKRAAEAGLESRGGQLPRMNTSIISEPGASRSAVCGSMRSKQKELASRSVGMYPFSHSRSPELRA